MKQFIYLLALLVPSLSLLAQAEITGTVIDSTGTTLPGANAVLMQSSDSLLVGFGTTDDKGVFRMTDVKPGDYFLRLSFLGYERPDRPIKVGADDQYFGLGELTMYPAGLYLSGVEVNADRIPIRMKGDTMLYDAAAFGVSENAVVEDLLRRLPGMTVDASGQITWQGKPISEVMINGKPFFGGNTTLLTQNLDAKAVKNVEIFDQKSDEEEVTGVDDGNENITVNLETKEEFKAKVFGDVYAGYGTQDRYQAGGKGFRISDATQWGILGTINNINQVGFSGDEISGFNRSSGQGGGWWNTSGGLEYDGGDASGQNRSIAGGLNFGKTLGKDGQFTANYALFDRTQAQVTESLQSFNQNSDNRIIATDEVNNASNYRHSIEFEFRQKVDSVGRIRINGGGSMRGGNNTDFSRTAIRNLGQEQEYTVDNVSNTELPRGEIRASYNTKLSKDKNRTLRLATSARYQENDEIVFITADGLTDSLNIAGALVNGMQQQDRLSNNLQYEASAEYGEPIAEKWNLEVQLDYEVDREEGNYSFLFNEATTTNDLTRAFTIVRPGLGIENRFGKGGSFSFGADYAATNLTLEGDVNSDRDFNYVLPYIRYRKRLEKGFLSLRAGRGYDAPGINQLQTIAQPGLNGRVAIGNPELTPTTNYNFNGFLWYSDQFRAISGNASFDVRRSQNAFGSEISFNKDQQIFRTINVDDAFYASFNLSGQVGMDFINGEMRVNSFVSSGRTQGIVEGVTRENFNNSYGGEITITTEMNEDSYLTVGYGPTVQANRFVDAEQVNTTQVVHDLSIDLALEFVQWLRFETRFAYNLYEETEFAPQQNLFNMRVGAEVRPFKKAGHYFRLSGSDLFDQNRIVRRRVNEFVTTESSYDALGRYFLATFFYKL